MQMGIKDKRESLKNSRSIREGGGIENALFKNAWFRE